MIVLTVDSLATLLSVVVVDLQTGPNTQPTARVRVPKAAFGQMPVDWHSDCELLSVQDGISTLLMRGTVYTVEPLDAETVELDIRSWPDLLHDVGTPGIAVEDAPRADVAWSVLMTAGLDPDSVSVEGKVELPVEEFRVIAPVYGLRVEQPTVVDRVQLLPSPHAAPMAVPPELSYLAEPFRSCSGIAVAEISAQTLFEAEQAGLAEIDYALGVVLLVQRVASTDFRASLRYSRESAVANLGRYPVVAVLGRWGRRWMRETRAVRPAGKGPATLEVEASWLPAFADVPPQLRQAISSWRRAVEEIDGVPRLLALWEALEFYAAGVNLPRQFTRSDIKRLKERATVDLNPDQVERFEELIQQLNSPPLMAKLEHAAATDGVAVSLGDLTVLRRLRGARNDIVHGRRWIVQINSDLRKGLGVATRLLLARLDRVPSTSEPQPSGWHRTITPSDNARNARSGGKPPSTTFTQNDKRWAEQATETTMLMMPYLERGELVPGPVRSRIQRLWSGATEEALVVGMMRACDVAIKHLAKHFLGGSLKEAAINVAARLAQMQSHDAGGFGPVAYDDGARAIRHMTEAMTRHGRIHLPEDLADTNRVFPAFNVALVAMLFELAERYGISPTRAAGNLGQEISTIVPRPDPPTSS